MISIIIWFAAFLCPNQADNPGSGNQTQITASTSSDTGGETGGYPKPPVPPPPPPPPGN